MSRDLSSFAEGYFRNTFFPVCLCTRPLYYLYRSNQTLCKIMTNFNCFMAGESNLLNISRQING